MIQMQEIGTYHGHASKRYDVPRQSSIQDHHGLIQLNAKSMYEQALEDLIGFERIWVVYLFHLNTSHWKPKVNTPRSFDGLKKGVFATRAPYRPNPIGLSCVKLVDVQGLKIYVSESDLLDGSPILDIKPYLPYADSFPTAKAGWVDQAATLSYQIHFSEESKVQIQWLKDKTGLGFEDFIQRNLEFLPLNTRHKRVRKLGLPDTYSIALQTWRVRFHLDEANRQIQILDLYPGYSELQLTQEASPQHLEFLNLFQVSSDYYAQEIKP